MTGREVELSSRGVGPLRLTRTEKAILRSQSLTQLRQARVENEAALAATKIQNGVAVGGVAQQAMLALAQRRKAIEQAVPELSGDLEDISLVVKLQVIGVIEDYGYTARRL